MFNKLKKLTFVGFVIFTLSGCGVFHYPYSPYDELGRQYIHSPYHYHFSPYRDYIIQHNSPRYRLNQNINNSININGASYRELEGITSKIVFVDTENYGILNAVDGTINQALVEERRRYKIPVCQTAIQSVQAINYNSFQYTSCN